MFPFNADVGGNMAFHTPHVVRPLTCSPVQGEVGSLALELGLPILGMPLSPLGLDTGTSE